MYEAKKSYKSGKINPFEEYKEPENVVDGNTTNPSGGDAANGNTTPASTNQITPTVTNTTSTQGSFFEKPNSK
jgi:hypothetical protein